MLLPAFTLTAQLMPRTSATAPAAQCTPAGRRSRTPTGRRTTAAPDWGGYADAVHAPWPALARDQRAS